MSVFDPIFTERLVLREFNINDWQGAHGYLSDPEVLQFMEFYPCSDAQSKDYVNRLLSFQKEEPRKYFKFAVVLKQSGVMIGECGLLMPDQINENAELCFRFNKDYWSKGYATEASKAMLEFGFFKLDLHKINAVCDIRNTASVKVMENIGMQKEGCLREHKWVKDSWRTSLIYSILEQELAAINPNVIIYAFG